MTDTLTPNKGLTLQGIGGNNNTWGTVLNGTMSLIDLALGGTLTKSISGNSTLNSTEAENTGFIFTGTLSANATVTFPAFYGFGTLYNNTIGGFDLSVGITGKVVVPSGEFAVVWSNGTNFYRLTAGYEGFTKTMTGLADGTGDNTTTFNAEVSPGNTTTNPALSVFPRGNWRFSGTIDTDDLTTLMMLPGTKLGFYDASATGNTHTTTTVDGLSFNVLTAGWQVGMSVRSSNAEIPNNTTITAIDPGGLSLTLSAAATGTNTGSTLSVYGGTMSALPSIQWYQFSQKQIGLGYARSMSLAGTATGGLDGRGSGTADQSLMLLSTISQISNSLTSYNKRAVFVQTDQLDSSPVTANGTNASPNRNVIGLWSGITSRVTPGSNGYPYTVHGRITGVYSKATIAKNASAFTRAVQVELNNNSTLPVQKFPYLNGGTAFSLLNSSAIGAIGTGYALNDIVTLSGGTFTTAAQVKITAVDPFLLQGSSTIGAAGSAYTVNDVLTLVGGTHTVVATITVLTVDGGGAVQTFSVTDAGSYSVKPTNPIAVTGGSGTGFTLNGVWLNTGNVVTFAVQGGGGSYSVLPSNNVVTTGGAGTGFTLTAAWAGSQASNHGMVIVSTGNTAATSAIAVLADNSNFWDGIMFDAAAVQNNVLSVVQNPGSGQTVLASVDAAGFMRSTGLICTNDGTTVSKVRSKNSATGDAVFLADTPGQKWQFGIKNSDGSFKLGNTESTAWTGEVLSLTPNGDITLKGANTFTPNGAVAISLTNVAPTGASATVQKWFTVSDGTRKYYIPAF